MEGAESTIRERLGQLLNAPATAAAAQARL